MGEVTLEDVVYFDLPPTHNPETGGVIDADELPTFAVYENANDTPLGISGTTVKRSGTTGEYRGSFTASLANGFDVGKVYTVVASATVDAIDAKVKVMTFRCMASDVDVLMDGQRALGEKAAAVPPQWTDSTFDPATDSLQALADGGVIINNSQTTTSDGNDITINIVSNQDYAAGLPVGTIEITIASNTADYTDWTTVTLTARSTIDDSVLFALDGDITSDPDAASPVIEFTLTHDDNAAVAADVPFAWDVQIRKDNDWIVYPLVKKSGALLRVETRT